MTLCGWKIFSRNKQKLNNKNNDDSNLEIVTNLTENLNENILLESINDIECRNVVTIDQTPTPTATTINQSVTNPNTVNTISDNTKICDNDCSKRKTIGIFKKHFSCDFLKLQKKYSQSSDGNTSNNNNQYNKKINKNKKLDFGDPFESDNFDDFLLGSNEELFEVNLVKNSKNNFKNKKNPKSNNNDKKNDYVGSTSGGGTSDGGGISGVFNVKKILKKKNGVVNGDNDDDYDDEKNSFNIDNDDDEEGNPRNKCALKPGHSLMDWIRVGSSGIDLAGTRGIVTPVSTNELNKHCKQNDAWIAIRGKVYNVTRYMDFHPGGPEELIKGVGTDATKMFDDIHAWVNYEQLLAKCYIGPLRNIITIDLEPMRPRQKATTPTPDKCGSFILQSDIDSDNDSDFKRPKNLPIRLSNSEKTSPIKCSPISQKHLINLETNNSINMSDNRLTDYSKIIPRFDWLQKTSELSLIFYTKPFCNPGIIVQKHEQNLNEITIRILINSQTHTFHFQFQHSINWPCIIRISCETGKIEVICCKLIPELWTAYGQMNREINRTEYNDSSCITDNNKIDDVSSDNYFNFEIIQCNQINHDSYALELRSQNHNNIILIPIGYHISVAAFVNDEYVTRSYTPVPVNYVPFVCKDTANILMLIKSYSMGLLAKHITSININNTDDNKLKISLPKGNFQLTKLLEHRKFGLLAAGSGITPILSVLDHILARMNNKIEHIELMLFNKTEEDIWCRDKLETIAKKDNRLKIRHILSDGDNSWTGEIGRVSENLLTPLFDIKSNCHVTFCCICGPTPFNDFSKKLLTQIGFTSEQLHFFQG